MSTSAVQSGVSKQELYFVRETADASGDPIAPTDPDWLLFSSVVSNTEYETNPNFDARQGLGAFIAQDKTRQQEDHTVTVGYDLEKFPTTSGGSAQDAWYDVSKRNADNQVASTHSVLRVEEFSSVATENTVHYRYLNELGNSHPSTDPGATSKATRKETYSRGCIPEEGTMTLNPGDSATAAVEISYIATKTRPYQFDQPASSTDIAIRSSDSGDTGLDVDIETDDGATSETLTTDGSDATANLVTSAESYGSLRVSTNGDHAGYIEVYAYDSGGSTAEQLLAVIPGSTARDGVEADSGVPMLAGGSFEDESTLGDGIPAALSGDITFDGVNAAQYIGELELTVSNEVSDQTTSSGLSKFINAGGATITLSATVFGQVENVDYFKRMLRGQEGRVRLPTASGDIDLERAYVDEVGEEVEAGSAVALPETTFQVLEPASGDPIQYNNTT
jgi:hypothetical protein